MNKFSLTMNFKMSSYFLLIVISCGKEAFDLPRSTINELRSEKNVLAEWTKKNITRQFKNNLMKKTATKLMLDLFNKTEDNIFSILSERTVYNFEEHDSKRIYLRYNTSGLEPLVKQSHSSVLKFYKRAVIEDENRYLVFLHRIRYLKNSTWSSTVINYAFLTGDYEGWTTMNVGRALKFWNKNGRFNYGCFIMALSLVDDSEVDVRDIGIVGFEDDVNEPFILGFGKNRRRPVESSGIVDNSDARALQMPLKGMESNVPASAPRKDLCRVRPWFVMYEDLGIENVLAPMEGYWANYCSGKCSIMEAKIHHSMLQAMVNLKKPYIVPALNCGPTKYMSTDFLYYVNNRQIVKNTVYDMSVKNCGCV